MIPKELYSYNHLNPNIPIFIQIKSMITSINNKKNIKSTKNDILYLVNLNGREAQKYMFMCLFQTIQIKQLKEKGQPSPKIAFLTQQLTDFSTREPFLYYFPQALFSASTKNTTEYIQTILKFLKLSIQTQLILSLSMYLSENPQMSKEGMNLLKSKLKQYHQSGKPITNPPPPPRFIQQLLFQIGKNPQLLQDLQDEYKYLLQTNPVDKIQQARCHHYLNKNPKVFNYEPFTIVEKKVSDLIKKVDILRDLGPYGTFNVQSMKTIFQQYGPFTEEDVFDCLMLMSETNTFVQQPLQRFMTDLLVAHRKCSKTQQWKKFYTNHQSNEKKMQAEWNVQNFLIFAVQSVKDLKWVNVMNYFDRPKLNFTSHEAFLNMFKLFQKAKKNGPKYKFQQNLFFKKWNNPKSQITFLINVFKTQKLEIFSFNDITNKRIVKSLSQTIKSNPNSNAVQYPLWGYIDLIQLLVQLSQYNYMGVRQIFDIGLNMCPDILAQTLSEIKPTVGQAILDQLFSQIFPIYLSNHTTYIKLLETMWQNNEELVISNICQLYKNENKKQNSCLNLSRVLDITQNIRESLIPLTNWNDYNFAVALGILAGKRQFLHFEQWIKQRLKNVGSPFLNAILLYVDQNLLAPVRQIITTYGTNYASLSQSFDLILQKAQLSRQLLAFIFESALQIPGNKFSIRTVEKLKKLYKQVCQYFPELSQTQMPDQIQLLAEKHFHRIYKQEVTLDETIQMMIKLKNSNKQQQKQLYASMITFLFTELRFHSNYPEKQLMITANFFAGIINNNLIEKKLFNVFLQVLKDDLKLTNKKFDFAIHVVQKIKLKLKDQPQFCQTLIDSEPLLLKNPQLITQLIKNLVPPITLSPQKSLQLQNALNAKLMPPPPPVVVQQKPIKIQADLDLLQSQDKSLHISIGDKQKKITTIFNTISSESINERVKDLEKLLDTKQSLKWFSYYLVFRRISHCNQSTALEVYINLFNKFKRAEKYIMKVTYKILQKWFSLSGKSVNDKRAKNIKNIGFWLGKVTLARNQPILINKLNIKQILLTSFRKKTRLSLNLEVILKILESIKQSKIIFCVKNPWLYPILCILKQIIQWVESNQSNQIQRYFKTVNIDEENIQGTQLLSFDQQNKPASLTIAQLPNFVQINQQQLGVYFDKGIDLRKIIAQTVDSAIQQIVPPVIARSVTIALVTTKQLALKDFANQPDQKRLLKGTHLIAQNLAGSLALVTCREPLRMSLANFMKKKLQQYPNLTQQDKDIIIAAAARDNLDLGCALIKKAVIQKALEDISKDSLINENIQNRRLAVEQNKTYYNEKYLNQIADYVPQPLRPKYGGLTIEEFKIYEDFNKDKRTGYMDPKDTSKQKAEKIINSIKENQSISQIKQLINKTQINQTQLAQKIQLLFAQSKDNNTNYFIDILKLLKQSIQPQDVYKHFKQHMNPNRKDYQLIISELARSGYFPQTALDQIKKTKVQTNYKDQEEQKRSIKILQDWINCQDNQIGSYFSYIQQHFNKGGEDKIKKFFYFNLNYAAQKVLQTQNISSSETLDFLYIDQYSKLITISFKLIVMNNRSVYLEYVCQAIFKVIAKYHDNPDKPFNQRPFFKLLLNLIYDMIRKTYSFQTSTILTVYTVLARLFHKLQPLNYPGFCFAWLELISNKYFMPTILEKHEYWDTYHELIVDLLKFSKQKLTEQILNKQQSYRTYYKGILRVVIMLLHDYPDFFSEFSISLTPQIADRFIQLRNIILSAFPKQLKFPQPQNFTELNQLEGIENSKKLPVYYNIKFDKSVELSGILKSTQKFNILKSKVEKQNFNMDLFALQTAYLIYENGSSSNNSVQQKKILQLEEENSNLLLALLLKLSIATKANLIKSILNLIRYPNIITLFFIRLVTKLLYEDTEQHLKVLLIKNILERMKMQKPHPWGLIFVTNQMKVYKKKLIGLNLKQIQEL